MPIVSKFYGIVVRLLRLPGRGLAVYANYGDQEVVLDAATLRVIAGAAPARVVDLVLEWADLHRAELHTALSDCQAGHVPAHIAPLV